MQSLTTVFDGTRERFATRGSDSWISSSRGCSGYRYGMMLEDAPTEDDRVLQANGVRVYIDGKSVDLLQGSQIDYVDTLMGAGFTVNNPNAVAACGCGSSFRTADDTGSPRACAH